MKWDNTYVPTVERTVGQRVQAAGYYLLGKIREEISTSGRTVTSTVVTRGAKKGQTKKVVGPMNSNPSPPGEAPNRQSGRYRASQAQQYDPGTLTSRVGSPMALALWLNLGTARMAARPHYRPVLTRESPALLRIVTTGSAK